MYSGRIQTIAIVGSVLLLVFILFLIRKKRLKEEYSILWLLFGFIFLILSSWRGSIDFLAELVGIAYSPAALFLVFLIAIFFIMIEFSLIISQLSDINRSLAQDIGLMKEEIEILKKETTKKFKQTNQEKDSKELSGNDLMADKS